MDRASLGSRSLEEDLYTAHNSAELRLNAARSSIATCATFRLCFHTFHDQTHFPRIIVSVTKCKPRRLCTVSRGVVCAQQAHCASRLCINSLKPRLQVTVSGMDRFCARLPVVAALLCAA